RGVRLSARLRRRARPCRGQGELHRVGSRVHHPRSGSDRHGVPDPRPRPGRSDAGIMNSLQAQRREWLVLLVLSGIQFSQMVDFMVLMPLGTQLMREFGITPTQLGFFVSIYTVAASLSGFFSALVIDRFDRRTAVLTLYGCFAATM